MIASCKVPYNFEWDRMVQVLFTIFINLLRKKKTKKHDLPMLYDVYTRDIVPSHAQSDVWDYIVVQDLQPAPLHSTSQIINSFFTYPAREQTWLNFLLKDCVESLASDCMMVWIMCEKRRERQSDSGSQRLQVVCYTVCNLTLMSKIKGPCIGERARERERGLCKVGTESNCHFSSIW